MEDLLSIPDVNGLKNRLEAVDQQLLRKTHLTGTPSCLRSIASGAGSGDSSSKAWIASAVIGPLALLCVVGVGAYFLIAKRRRQKTVAPQPLDDTYFGGKPELDGGLRPDVRTNHTQEIDDVLHMSELPGHHLSRRA